VNEIAILALGLVGVSTIDCRVSRSSSFRGFEGGVFGFPGCRADERSPFASTTTSALNGGSKSFFE
jgi:hypothetical protein